MINICRKMTDIIGGYKVNLRARIGRGAIGTVFTAKDQDDNLVAAKQVDEKMAEKTLVRELENAHKQKRLNHENIVKILHIYSEQPDEDTWVFMEYLNGGDLNKYALKNFAKFFETKLDTMVQMARGLAFLHESKICHRDIKPENILIEDKGNDQPICVKLTDFGLAKFQSPDAESSIMHTKLGTQNYMAPEFWKIKPDGTVDYHKSVDTYALGLTFLAMLNSVEGQKLKPIAEGCDESESGQPIGLVMFTRNKYNHQALDVVSDKENNGCNMQAVKRLIRKATLFQPEKRPSAREMLEQLEAIQVL